MNNRFSFLLKQYQILHFFFKNKLQDIPGYDEVLYYMIPSHLQSNEVTGGRCVRVPKQPISNPYVTVWVR